MIRQISAYCLAGVAFLLFSCNEKQCERDNTGNITIINNTETDMLFDIRESNNEVNFIRRLESGASAIYTVAAGTVYVWGSLTQENSSFSLIESIMLDICDEFEYYTSDKACSTLGLGNLEIKNEYDYSLIVDVNIENYGYLGARNLEAQTSVLYDNVPAGSNHKAEFYVKQTDDDDWFIGEKKYVIPICGFLIFKWTENQGEIKGNAILKENLQKKKSL